MEIGKLEDKVCPVCGAEEVYIGKGAGSITGEHHETLIEWEGRTCTCHECGTPIYSESVNRFNRVAVAEATRTIHPNLLKVSEIRGLPVRYAIPRKYFKVVMGIPSTHTWHDDPVPFRIFDGELPTYEEEKRLRAIYNDPRSYIEYLKHAEGKIPEDVFEKSMKKAESMVKTD